MLKQMRIYLKYAIVLLFPILIGCGPEFVYLPAGSLAPRPVYVYPAKKIVPTLSLSTRSTAGYNSGETSQLSVGSLRMGGRFLILQSFVGLSGYSGFYKTGAIDSNYVRRTVYGISPEIEVNIVIPIRKVSIGIGMYTRSSSEAGEFHDFTSNLPQHGENGTDIGVNEDNFVDLHTILCIHGKLDYTFILGGFDIPDTRYNNWGYDSSFLGIGVSSETVGGWITVTPSAKPHNGSYLFDAGISYRFTNFLNQDMKK